jgi:hypothetical protein
MEGDDVKIDIKYGDMKYERRKYAIRKTQQRRLLLDNS